MNSFEIIDLGVIDYRAALLRQKEIIDLVQQEKRPSTLMLCEHPTVITLGRSTKEGNITASKEFLQQNGIDTFEINRGGDVTLHNIGQLVGYPIFNLAYFKTDLHWFLRAIEDCIIDTISHWGLTGGREKGLTGVWIDGNRKICAIGLHCSQWVTSHGFALNVNNDLKEFSYIVPCGIREKEVTSIAQETGKKADFDLVKKLCIHAFQEKFNPKKIRKEKS